MPIDDRRVAQIAAHTPLEPRLGSGIRIPMVHLPTWRNLMALLYGVLRGRPDRYQREDGAKTPHLQIRVLDETGQPWRLAVNVQSSDKSEVVYWIVDPLTGHPVLGGLPALQSGFTEQPPNSSTTLDFVKAPLFDFGLGRVLPPTGSGNGDDLQDLLSLYLDQCKAAGGEIFAFGAKFTSNQHLQIDTDFGDTDGLHGIHDIHMNQGNTGSFATDNGVVRRPVVLGPRSNRIWPGR
jgi:uncharacterized protein YukJ